MKIYFTGSLHNIKVNKNVYKSIVKTLENFGHKVQADHILKESKEDLDKKTPDQRSKYYKKMNKAITSSEIVVAEVSFPSTINIGHEVSLALDKGKPIIALYLPNREPGVLQGIKSDRFILLEYSPNDLKDILDYGLEEAVEQIDVRFNFFISPSIGNYLNWIAKRKKVPRAVYLRKLIEKRIKEDKDYQK